MVGEQMRPKPMVAVINQLVYDTEKATVIASDAFFDGKNWERKGTNTFLFKTKKGRYFKQYLTRNAGDNPHLAPLTENEAITLFFELMEARKAARPFATDDHDKEDEKQFTFEQAFPGVKLEDA